MNVPAKSTCAAWVWVSAYTAGMLLVSSVVFPDDIRFVKVQVMNFGSTVAAICSDFRCQ